LEISIGGVVVLNEVSDEVSRSVGNSIVNTSLIGMVVWVVFFKFILVITEVVVSVR